MCSKDVHLEDFLVLVLELEEGFVLKHLGSCKPTLMGATLKSHSILPTLCLPTQLKPRLFLIRESLRPAGAVAQQHSHIFPHISVVQS